MLLDSDGENKTPHADKDAEKDEDDKENADNSASVPPVDEVAEDEDEEIAEDDVEIVPPIFMQARDLFLGAPVTPAAEIDLKWSGPDADGLRKFLVDRMCFNPDRVNKNIENITIFISCNFYSIDFMSCFPRPIQFISNLPIFYIFF